MKEKRIFTQKLALYLTGLGFVPIRIVVDIHRPDFKNWIFEETPELLAAMGEYSK